MAWVQTARPRIDAALAEVDRAPSAPPDGAWAHPEAGLPPAAHGAAEVREGSSLRDVLASLDSPAELPVRLPGPWFGAASFPGPLGRDWAGFAPLRFTLPALLAWTDRDRHFLASWGPGAQERLDSARARLDAQAPTLLATPAVRVLRRPGERERWTALVQRALAAIRAGALDKVVLARAIDVEAEASLDPASLLRALESRYPTCRAFLVRGSEGVFLGATPEILCRIEGDEVQADALAGS